MLIWGYYTLPGRLFAKTKYASQFERLQKHRILELMVTYFLKTKTLISYMSEEMTVSN